MHCRERHPSNLLISFLTLICIYSLYTSYAWNRESARNLAERLNAACSCSRLAGPWNAPHSAATALCLLYQREMCAYKAAHRINLEAWSILQFRPAEQQSSRIARTSFLSY